VAATGRAVVAMKAATDNTGELIGDLKLVYNKPGGDHAGLAEIVSGRGG
jgi:F0F1-type ATP synthase gamma subunit